MSKSQDSQGYVFQKGEDGGLTFVGDFEGYYRAAVDPWGQSGDEERMREYYSQSRQTLIDVLRRHGPLDNVLEVGCGLGYVVARLSAAGIAHRVDGLDISPTAIEKARRLHPEFRFHVADIGSPDFTAEERYDVVILNQMLWYVLENFQQVLDNVEKILIKDGVLVISNAFLQDQKYGAEIMDGFDGMLQWMLTRSPKTFRLIFAQFDDSGRLSHNDGIAAFRTCARSGP